MWQEIFNLALNNGIWAVLFLALLIYQLKDSREREQKYQTTITQLNSSLTIVNKVNENIEEIKTEVGTISNSVDGLDKKLVKVSADVALLQHKRINNSAIKVATIKNSKATEII